jgi:hypothetical protein
VKSATARPPTAPPHRRPASQKVVASSGALKQRAPSIGSVDSFATPTGSVHVESKKISHRSPRGPARSDDSSTYSLDDDFVEEGEISAVRQSRDMLSMPATAVLATSRTFAHDIELSPERMKRNASKKVRGVTAVGSIPMSHWKFQKNKELA